MMPIYPDKPFSSNVDNLSTHFGSMALTEATPLSGCSDCIVCGKTVAQIQQEENGEYLSNTVTIGETPMITEGMRKTFLDGISAETFLLMSEGVSQAPACDGNLNSINYVYYNEVPGAITLN